MYALRLFMQRHYLAPLFEGAIMEVSQCCREVRRGQIEKAVWRRFRISIAVAVEKARTYNLTFLLKCNVFYVTPRRGAYVLGSCS